MRNTADKSTSSSKARSLDFPEHNERVLITDEDNPMAGLTPIVMDEDASLRVTKRDLESAASRLPGSFGVDPMVRPTPIVLDEDASLRVSKRDLKSTAHRIPGSFGDDFLLSLVDEINATCRSCFIIIFCISLRSLG